MKKDRLISLNAAIEAIHNYWIAEMDKLPRKMAGEYEVLDGDYKTPLRHNKKICEAIEALPSAQPGWIPWNSGRFPEESGTYTVTAYDGATKRVTYAKYQKRLKRWELTGARAYWRVLAWMPSPEPYRQVTGKLNYHDGH